MITQKQLYQYNQQRITDTGNHNPFFLTFEKNWIDSVLEPLDRVNKYPSAAIFSNNLISLLPMSH